MSVIQKRSLSLHGHRTSIALEPEFWAVIDAAALQKSVPFAQFIMFCDDQRIASHYSGGLASYLRVWALKESQSNNQGKNSDL